MALVVQTHRGHRQYYRSGPSNVRAAAIPVTHADLHTYFDEETVEAYHHPGCSHSQLVYSLGP
jgi:hypothetical protein